MATHYGNNTVTGIISDVRVGLSRFVFDRPLARLVYSPSGGYTYEWSIEEDTDDDNYPAYY